MTPKTRFVAGCLIAVAASIGTRIAIAQPWVLYRDLAPNFLAPGSNEPVAINSETQFSGDHHRKGLGAAALAAIVSSVALLLVPRKARRWVALISAAALIATIILTLRPASLPTTSVLEVTESATYRTLTIVLAAVGLIGAALAARDSNAPTLRMPEGPPSEHETEDAGVWE